MNWAQIVVFVLLIVALFSALKTDINGQKAKPPGGFSDVVVTIITVACLVFIYWRAGLFSTLVRS